MELHVFCGLFGCFLWLWQPRVVGKGAFCLVSLVFLIRITVIPTGSQSRGPLEVLKGCDKSSTADCTCKVPLADVASESILGGSGRMFFRNWKVEAVALYFTESKTGATGGSFRTRVVGSRGYPPLL